MTVAENDPAVEGLLKDEHRRCLEVLAALQEKVSLLPKGALNVRIKAVGGKSYSYHYLVFREGGRVVNRHIPKSDLPALQAQLLERDKCRKEIASYRRRIAYLERLLRERQRRKGLRARGA